MFKKICNKCGCDSYSSSTTSNWKCPKCGEDLSKVEVTSAGINASTSKGNEKRLRKNRKR